MSSTQDILSRLRAGIFPAKNSKLQDRIALLQRFRRGLHEFQDTFIEALRQDFDKPAFESTLTEIFPIEEELKIFERNLATWMAPEKVPSPISLLGASSEIRSEAKGLVLIIAPWNYPLALALVPLVGALASGNNVVLKPSELTPQVSKAIREFVAKYLPADRVVVLEGGKELSEELLREPFDHIFLTGSTEVGRIVMRAAAEHLTPVTLELGGKSPTIVTPGYDLKHAAERIVWGKVVNSGQTCVAPDYAFVHETEVETFLAELRMMIQKIQPDSGATSASIITERHADRLRKMLIAVTPDAPTSKNSEPRKLALQLILNPAADSQLMNEEIFGPILPIMTYKSLDEVEAFIQARPRPLALYIFSSDSKVQERLLQNTHSGGVCINDCLLHLGNHHLPFGGSGPSGLGNYHGIASFRTFSHQRSVLRQGPLKKVMALLLPPYTNEKTAFLKKARRWI